METTGARNQTWRAVVGQFAIASVISRRRPDLKAQRKLQALSQSAAGCVSKAPA
jgi:hypothetical protein